MYRNSRNVRETACTHVSPVMVNAVEGGGWRAHCLGCGLVGPVGADSTEALHSLRVTQLRPVAFGSQALGPDRTDPSPRCAES